MENNNDVLTIKKVPLDGFIDVLMDLYNKGVDYIDITGVTNEHMDKMAISFTSDYMMEGSEENFENAPPLDIKDLLNQKLSEEDLDQLI
jgi:hypothetical protein